MRPFIRHVDHYLRACAVGIALSASFGNAATLGDPVQGAKAFGACLSCHSAEPGQNMTGPSLAGVWGRKAGSLPSFHRYSDALKHAGVVWNERSLDAWLTSPATLIPGNEMKFPGIPDARGRSDLIAYLKAESESKGQAAAAQAGVPTGAKLPDLKQASLENRVKMIRYCDDTYSVTTDAGKTRKFWEFNLRLKTDSTAHGPAKGRPVLVPQGMGGDRAQLVFADPGEISAFIKRDCS
ncbi:MAG: cytochrome c family protein [Bradyrhizobium sp.]